MKTPSRRFAVVLAICAGFTLLFLALYSFRGRQFTPLQNGEFATQDLRMRLGRWTPVESKLVLIGIDRPAYAGFFQPEELEAEPVLRQMENNFPWPRSVWARLIERLAEAGAKTIAVDLIFGSTGEGDEELKRVLTKYRDRVVIGYNINEQKTDRGDETSFQLPASSVIDYSASGHPVEDDRLGYISIWADSDTVLRRAYYRQTGEQMRNLLAPEIQLESLAARMLRKSGHADMIPSGFEPRAFRFTSPPGFGYKPHPVGAVLSPKLWGQNYGNGEFFRDKIVLIGPTAQIFQDFHTVPLNAPQPESTQDITRNQMAGPEIHLNIFAAALQREFLVEPGLLFQRLIIFLAGLSAFGLCFLVQQPIKRLLVVVALCIGYLILAQWLFNRNGDRALVIPIATPLLVLTLSSITTLAYDYLLERFEKRRIRRTLERYVSRDVVKELLDNPQTYFNTLGGVRKPVAILFSDVRGFTTLTESADSAALVKQLNEYFEEMVSLVFTHQGSLDKFIGDAVMAVWGNIVSHGAARDAHNAVATALAMKRSLKKLNEDWKARGMLELAFGIGLNHGEVIVGNLGSTEKMELTVIGDSVNLASRLEGLTKEYHLDLLLGESIAALVGDKYLLRTVDCVQVKGKTKPVDVFTVAGEGGAQTVSTPFWLARYEAGVRLYRQREFARAAKLFEESLRRQPGDYLSEMYLKRCAALIENPPDESWNGVFVMTKK